MQSVQPLPEPKIAATEHDGRKRVMVVEDEDACRLLLEAHLERFPVDVFCYGSAESALADLERVRPDLVLMDLVLPRMDGIVAIERIRCQDGFEQVPIVVITNLNEASASVRARDAGATTYVVKPVTLQAIAQAVHRFLGILPR